MKLEISQGENDRHHSEAQRVLRTPPDDDQQDDGRKDHGGELGGVASRDIGALGRADAQVVEVGLGATGPAVQGQSEGVVADGTDKGDPGQNRCSAEKTIGPV